MRSPSKAALLLVAVVLATPAWASDMVGVYALIDKVIVEPSESAPERIQIWGVFALAEGRGDHYQPAQRGYLYYALNREKQSVCLKEWADLRAIAGTGQALGLGGRYHPKARVRKGTEKPEGPDTYPVAMGLVKVLDRHLGPQIEKELKSMPREK